MTYVLLAVGIGVVIFFIAGWAANDARPMLKA